MEDITKQTELVETMRTDVNNNRSRRWRLWWVESSWAQKKKDIYIWIRGNKRAGPLIVIPGGSAHITDRLKEAENTWGGLWA
eukprot:6139381-Heterocapsa_arctica.AAC.1